MSRLAPADRPPSRPGPARDAGTPTGQPPYRLPPRQRISARSSMPCPAASSFAATRRVAFRVRSNDCPSRWPQRAVFVRSVSANAISTRHSEARPSSSRCPGHASRPALANPRETCRSARVAGPWMPLRASRSRTISWTISLTPTGRYSRLPRRSQVSTGASRCPRMKREVGARGGYESQCRHCPRNGRRADRVTGSERESGDPAWLHLESALRAGDAGDFRNEARPALTPSSEVAG